MNISNPPSFRPAPRFGTRNLSELKARAEREQATHYSELLVDKFRSILDQPVTAEESGWDILCLLGQVVQEQEQDKTKQARANIVEDDLIHHLFPTQSTKVLCFLRQISGGSGQDFTRNQIFAYDGKSVAFTHFGKWLLQQPQLDIQG